MLKDSHWGLSSHAHVSNINKHNISGAGPCVPKSHFVGSPAHEHVTYSHALDTILPTSCFPRLSKLLYSSHEVDVKCSLQVQQQCVGSVSSQKHSKTYFCIWGQLF